MRTVVVSLATSLLALSACDSGRGPVANPPPPPPAPNPPAPQPQQFVDATMAAGLDFSHRLTPTARMPSMIGGGAACGDYDDDGWMDLYLVGGPGGADALMRNRGDGTFEDVTDAAGLGIQGEHSGPTFADVDGDGALDLFLGGLEGTGNRLFRGRGDGTFEDFTAESGLVAAANTFSAVFGDYDHDGDLDLFMTHWSDLPLNRGLTTQHLWQNDGTGRFADVSIESGIAGTILVGEPNRTDFSFTPNFADVDEDGWLDLLIVSDYGQSQVYRNLRDGRFGKITDRNVITDENGMGSAVGDYDNDGDLDWFVSSIWDPNGIPEGWWGVTGNRLYSNRGNGTFVDVTTDAGVRVGYWGWGSTFADFDQDGWLDLLHVNGFGVENGDDLGEFWHDPTRLFMSNGDGTFAERSVDLGMVDDDQGRGVVCLDYDRDGDLDVLVLNNGSSPRLWRNDHAPGRSLTVRLRGRAPNTQGIGARVYLHVGTSTLMREVRCGCNFVSQDPAMAHFGVGTAETADVMVLWPDSTTSWRYDQPTSGVLTVEQR